MFNLLHSFHPSPVIISFGSFNIYWYGLFVVLGVLAGLTATLKIAKKFGLSANKAFDLSFWLIVGGLIGARIYHVILEWPFYSQHLDKIYKVWEGGLAIHGAIITGLLLMVYFAKKEKIDFWTLSGMLVPGIILGQAIGRWGNYFNQELFGRPTDLPWGIPIDLINRPYRYIGSEFFHPTFLYESLGNLAIFAILLILAVKVANKKIANSKILLLSYLGLYSLLRFSLEFLRVDQTAYVFGWRWPQILSLAVFAGAAIWLAFSFKKKKGEAN